MSNAFKILLIVSFFTISIPVGSTQSLAYGHGGGGFHGGGGYHGYGGYGHIGYSYWPYDDNLAYYYPYYPSYYPSYYDTGVIVSSPVVQTPEIIVQPAIVNPAVSTYPTTVISSVQTTTPIDENITVNIPNAAEGYSAVLIKRSGKGFIGPQGEYYPEFPKVSVLKVLYGK